MKQRHISFFKNGSWLASLILGLGVLGSGLTVWNYSQHVFSTNNAHVVSSDGTIEAFFSEHLIKKITSHEVARVTFKNDVNQVAFRAEVVSLRKNAVTLQLLPHGPLNLHPEESCSVTIDATVPQEEQKD